MYGLNEIIYENQLCVLSFLHVGSFSPRVSYLSISAGGYTNKYTVAVFILKNKESKPLFFVTTPLAMEVPSTFITKFL